MQEIFYKDYKIKATAFMGENEKWIGQATIEPLEGVMVRIADPLVFDNEQFDDELEAESFALDGAQFFIDTQLNDSGSE